jgi:uncharacterized membrane protein YgdD (TMEM256/DUF423 family)
MRPKQFLTIAAIAGGLTVAIGAFGAHGLKSHLSDAMLTVYQTGVHYQGLHSMALFGTGLLLQRHDTRPGRLAAWMFLAGILLFSGSLYLLAVSGIRWLGMITPIGGSAWIVGWVSLALASQRLPER